jgi:NitT/TauT family transport system substrate-binding protein
MKKTVLTKQGKILFGTIFCIIILGILVSGSLAFGPPVLEKMGFASGFSGFGSLGGSRDYVRITLDEWVGWKSLLDANGGLKTAKGSINDKLGIKVEYIITNDAATSSNLLIKGDIKAAGYTVNRYAFLAKKFDDSGIDTKMVYITNFSNGGDGIIANANITGIEDLQGKSIAIPRFSEAHTLVEWLLNASDLSADVKDGIRGSYVFFETPDDCAKAFFAGQVDAAATWEPYLTQAKDTAQARVLFSTSQATNLILDGLVFRSDFLAGNRDFVNKLIDGALQAAPMYTADFKAIREMPLFATETDQSIAGMAEGAKLATWTENSRLLSGEAQSMFEDMSAIWLSIGERGNPDRDYAHKHFDISYLKTLESAYKGKDPDATMAISDVIKEEAAKNDEALMTKRLTVNFKGDSAVIEKDSYEALNEFAAIAKSLNNVIIQIEGNTADIGGGPASGIAFSEKRAQAIALYLQAQGIEADRFIVIGNGATKPLAPNDTEAGREHNRRTDIYFKAIE